ncbi:hypothetical protein GH733_009576 [Mirounga leonina]|nr:hypothetical protein GH733_009576 [Mirounga leonina]
MLPGKLEEPGQLWPVEQRELVSQNQPGPSDLSKTHRWLDSSSLRDPYQPLLQKENQATQLVARHTVLQLPGQGRDVEGRIPLRQQLYHVGPAHDHQGVELETVVFNRLIVFLHKLVPFLDLTSEYAPDFRTTRD